MIPQIIIIQHQPQSMKLFVHRSSYFRYVPIQYTLPSLDYFEANSRYAILSLNILASSLLYVYIFLNIHNVGIIH